MEICLILAMNWQDMLTLWRRLPTVGASHQSRLFSLVKISQQTVVRIDADFRHSMSGMEARAWPKVHWTQVGVRRLTLLQFLIVQHTRELVLEKTACRQNVPLSWNTLDWVRKGKQIGRQSRRDGIDKMVIGRAVKVVNGETVKRTITMTKRKSVVSRK